VQTLADNFGKLPTEGRILLLNSLAARGDKAHMPLALAAAKEGDGDLRKAGILALGRLGDVDAVAFSCRHSLRQIEL